MCRTENAPMYDEGMDLNRASVMSFVDPASRPSEDLTVQVTHDEDGRWHRRACGGGFKLACGRDESRGASLRHEAYTGPLCEDGCFSSWELGESVRLRGEELDAMEREAVAAGLSPMKKTP